MIASGCASAIVLSPDGLDACRSPAGGEDYCNRALEPTAAEAERLKRMPSRIRMWRYYGQKDFNSASTVELRAVRFQFIGYTAGHMGTAEVGEPFQESGQSFTSRILHSPWSEAPNVAEALARAGGREQSLLDHNQRMPLQVMGDASYLDPKTHDEQLRVPAARQPNQVTFFEGTESSDADKLTAEFGTIPAIARPKEKASVFAYGDDTPPKNQAYVLPVGTSWLISGQDLEHRYSLPLETPGLEKPIDPNEFEYKFEVGRGAQIRPGSFREAFRATAYMAYYEFLLREARAHVLDRDIHPSAARLRKAGVFAHVMNQDRLHHFTNPDDYGFQPYCGYSDRPQEFAIFQGLQRFVDSESIELFSSQLGSLVQSSNRSLNGRQALELVLDAKQRATCYLTEKNAEHPLEVQLRDYSSGRRAQAELQVEKSARRFPALAARADQVAGRLSQIRPVTESRDVTKELADLDTHPYHFYLPDEAPLPEFLEKQNAVEIVALDGLREGAEKEQRLLIGAYYEYVDRLRRLGAADPERTLSSLGVRFALTSFGADYGGLSGLRPVASWSVHRPEIFDVGNFLYGPIPLRSEISVYSDVFSVESIQALIGAHPAIALSVRNDHLFERGDRHYNEFMSKPELFSP